MSWRSWCGVIAQFSPRAIAMTYSAGGTSSLLRLSHFQTCPCNTLDSGTSSRIMFASATCPPANSTALLNESFDMLGGYSQSSIPVKLESSLLNKSGGSSFRRMEFSARLKQARDYANLSQEELSTRSGVKQGTISKIERGDSESSTFTVQLALACGIRPEWLAMGLGDMTGQPTLATQPVAAYEIRDPIQDDLAALDKFEADAYTARLDSLKAQIRSIEADIRSAANKARTKEKSDRQAASGPGDPHSEDRRRLKLVVSHGVRLNDRDGSGHSIQLPLIFCGTE